MSIPSSDPVAQWRCAWQDLFGEGGRGRFGWSQEQILEQTASASRWILSGSFNPLHRGHRQMAGWVESTYRVPVDFELSVENVDKPTLSCDDAWARAQQFCSRDTLWITRDATFVAKAKRFSGSTFLVGADTIARIADPAYYLPAGAGRKSGKGEEIRLSAHGDIRGMETAQKAIGEFARLGCRFLVFGRMVAGRFCSGPEQLRLPSELVAQCDWVPADSFRSDISSTELRSRGT